MKIHEKILYIRKKLGLTLQDVYNLQVQDFGSKDAISLRTLRRIEDGQIAKFTYIIKICQTLGITLVDLLRGTELEDRMLIKNNERMDSYAYSELAYANVVSSPSSSFLSMELTLQPGGKTIKEQSPHNGQRYEKHIYVIEGKITCFVGNDTYEIKRKDAISLNSTLIHWLENNTKSKAVCLVTQSPKPF